MPKIELICADTLTTLRGMASESVDAVVTSPPYNLHSVQHTRRGNVDTVEYDSIGDSLPEDVYQTQQIDVLNELVRVIRVGGSIFYNHKVRYRSEGSIHPMQWIVRSDAYAIFRQEIIWNRVITSNPRGWRFHQNDERVYWFTKGKIPEIPNSSAGLGAVWTIKPEMSRRNGHPAPFPSEIPRRCLRAVLPAAGGKLVLDPYCGSGTTGVVAQALCHSFVGIDISPNYIKMTRDRLQETRAWIQQ